MCNMFKRAQLTEEEEEEEAVKFTWYLMLKERRALAQGGAELSYISAIFTYGLQSVLF